MKRLLVFSSLGVVGLAAGGTVFWRIAAAPPSGANGASGAAAAAGSDARAASLDAWWKRRAAEPITVTLSGKPLAKATPTDLGIGLDAAATLAAAPEGEEFDRALAGGSFTPVFTTIKTPEAKSLRGLVAKALPRPAPARVVFAGGQIVRKPEAGRSELQVSRLPELGIAALKSNQKTIEAPLQTAPKRVSDEMLARITDVVSSFSTKFDAGNRPRSSNIRLAVTTLDGRVLMPNEVFSYNDALGERTIARGYKVAGVYVNGRRDTGVGGGICQVSTTLYDAALYANLGIVERQNHSLPVPYVPLGQDAVVNYGSLDLKFRNTTDAPIAISAQYTPGRITFRILGQKEPGLAVAVKSYGFHTTPSSVRRVLDRSLPAGATRVSESGGSGISCKTMRIVKKNGVVVKREQLTSSHYLPTRRIISYNPARPVAKRPAPKPAAPASPPAATIEE